MKNKKTIIIIGILIIALVASLYFDYSKHSREIPGKNIFSDSMEIDSI